MVVYCEAFVSNPTQQDNLMECIQILGGKPKKAGDKISVEYEGSDEECDIFISLFEHYSRHNITTFA